MSTSELIAPARLEELLGGAVPDTHTEARLQGLALELRSSAPAASEDLRRRVRALSVSRPPRQPFASRQRLALVLAPLVLVLVAVPVVFGRFGFGSSDTQVPKRALSAAVAHRAQASTAFQSSEADGLQKMPLLAPSIEALDFAGPTARARHVDMWIELRVRDADRLSAAANDAMRITRELGGFVASSTVGTRGDEGRAEMSIRVPVGRIDDALFRLSRLGAITGQRVATEDRQADIDRAAQRIETLRRAIAIAQLRLDSGTLNANQRLELEIRLARLRGELTSIRRSKARVVADAATADLSLVLHTQAAAGTTQKSGVGGIAHDALHVLGRVGAVALFAAIVLSPLVVLALLLWLVRRRRLRLQEAALLDRTRPGAPSPAKPS
jgi:hypothetical protein